VFVTAAVALYPNETVFKAPTAQVVTELVDDESRQRRVVSGQFVSKCRQVLLNNRVERGLFRFVASVPVDHRQW
jgi:hypothetical protein